MAKRRNYKPLTALIALAVAALVSAAVIFTNVTYWVVNATKPPAMKYPGADTSVAEGQYIKVSYYYDNTQNINITRISVIGFTGDPTNYTSALRICNYYGSTSVTAQLIYRGTVGSTGNEGYVKAFYVYWTNPYTQPGAGFIGSTTYTQSATVTINQGQCATVGVYLKIDPSIPMSLADGKTILATYQVDIQFTMS
ncbi:MAG: hypothetical protein ABWU84_10365 [Pyrobaculum sp.]|uniref:hypothetical protein n=1 Tax=Pyrobaculum sp. TaxID=2004705 RepID=UPI003EED9924